MSWVFAQDHQEWQKKPVYIVPHYWTKSKTQTHKFSVPCMLIYNHPYVQSLHVLKFCLNKNKIYLIWLFKWDKKVSFWFCRISKVFNWLTFELFRLRGFSLLVYRLIVMRLAVTFWPLAIESMFYTSFWSWAQVLIRFPQKLFQ